VVKVYLDLWQRGLFSQVTSVRIAGVPGYRREDFPQLDNWPKHPRCSLKSFYQLLGAKRYACVDLNGQHGAISLDLNRPLEDTSLYGQFDLVTDHGCAEHVFNIAEAYRTMHRLCRREGLIAISQHVCGGGNGYYNFDVSFFEGLAAANHYRVLFSSYVVAPKGPLETFNEFHVPLSRELLAILDWSRVHYIGICYVFQKQREEEFKLPYQGAYLSEREGNHGYELQFLPDPPSRTYVPVTNASLSTYLSTRALVGLTARRVVPAIRGRLSRWLKARG
jgi:SAM-dependent methyltransferase